MHFFLSAAKLKRTFFVVVFSSFFQLTSPAHAARDPDLLVSSFPDRSGAVSVDGAAVTGDIYAFIGPDSSVGQVEFFIDNVSARTERRAPYDLAGTSRDRTARPFDTTQLADGMHTLTAKLKLLDGSRRTVAAAFMVSNQSASSGATTDTTLSETSMGIAELTWVAPTTRSNGEPLPLSEIAGFVVRYGKALGEYKNAITINNAYADSMTVTDLPSDTYYFVVTTRDINGLESAYSEPATRVVP